MKFIKIMNYVESSFDDKPSFVLLISEREESQNYDKPKYELIFSIDKSGSICNATN